MKRRSLIASVMICLLAGSGGASASDISDVIDDVTEKVGDIVKGATAGRKLEEAEKVEVNTDEYGRLLYESYLALSSAEFDEGDYLDSDVFAERAMRAASNERFEPEALAARDLPGQELNEMQLERRRLVVTQFRGAPDSVAADTAEAQTSFDCWMQELEENLQPADIAACRARFTNAIARVETALKSETLFKPARLVLEVFFDFDSSALGEKATANIDAFVRATGVYAKPFVSVIGNADQVGETNYNVELSEKRAQTVADALKTRGVVVGGVFARGDQAPKVDRLDRGPDD